MSFFFEIVLNKIGVAFVHKKAGSVCGQNARVLVGQVEVGHHALNSLAEPDIALMLMLVCKSVI